MGFNESGSSWFDSESSWWMDESMHGMWGSSGIAWKLPFWHWPYSHWDTAYLSPVGGYSHSAVGHLVLPWWLRSTQWHATHSVVPYRFYDWFSGAYPHLGPYYPVGSPDLKWMDAWSMQPYHGFWS